MHPQIARTLDAALPPGVDLGGALSLDSQTSGDSVERESRSTGETPRDRRRRDASYYRALAKEMVAEARAARATAELPYSAGEWTSSDTGRLPEIPVNARPLSEVSRDALAALHRVNQKAPRVFSRGTSLSRVCFDEQGRPVISDIGPRELRHYLARSADFYRLSITQDREKGGKHIKVFTAVHPPDAVVNDILAAPAWPFPALAAVCETPVLRADGTMVTEPGYDAATSLYYHPEPGLRVPQIPDRPSRADVDAARALVHSAIGEFPYVDQASYANTLAILLTPVVRPMISGCVPLAMIDKPAAGTGASKLPRVISQIVAGSTKREINEAREDEEWRKSITATLSAGASVVIIDNVDGSLKSSSLARVLTNPVWEDRALGSNAASAAIRVPNRATWICTGNNVKLRGDIARRTYWSRPDAKVARPWQRDNFTRKDLEGWADEHRGELLAAVLTVARFWVVAGMPPAPGGRMGGFDSWERTIGGILATAGVEGFLGNLDRMYEESDEEDSQWEAFLELLALHLSDPKGAMNIAAMLQADEDAPPGLSERERPLGVLLREKAPLAITEKIGLKTGAFATELGKQFSKREGKRYGDRNLRLERVRDGKRKTNLWRVVSDDKSAEPSSSEATLL